MIKLELANGINAVELQNDINYYISNNYQLHGSMFGINLLDGRVMFYQPMIRVTESE